MIRKEYRADLEKLKDRSSVPLTVKERYLRILHSSSERLEGIRWIGLRKLSLRCEVPILRLQTRY
jgi:hypothetical protein